MRLYRRETTGAQSGIVLASVIVIMLVVMIAGGAFLTMAGSEAQQSVQNTLPMKAMYLAEAGCEWGKMWLAGQATSPSGTAALTVASLSLGDGSFTVRVEPHSDNNTTYIKSYDIVGVGSVMSGGEGSTVRASKSLTVTMRVESFARYAYFTESEYNPRIGGTIWFFDKDVITGPMHSNSRISISGDPVFRGSVTTTADSFRYYHGGPPHDKPVFKEGYELEAKRRELNKNINLSRIRTAAQSNGLYLDSTAAEIVLRANGTLSYRTISSGSTGSTGGGGKKGGGKKGGGKKGGGKKGGGQTSSWGEWRTVSMPSNGVAYSTGDVTVSGTLKGQCTVAVASGKSISIPDDIRYSVDPTKASCTDMLGLVAGKEIMITKQSPRGEDITIHASLLAFEESFGVKDYSKISAMGTIHVYGGIIQRYRGPVGTFSSRSGQVVSGYAKDYKYDERMMSSTPPYFPATGAYEFVSYEEGSTSFGD